ncbi:restriction endonuclease subunit S [Haliscomenobacter hydrossis]|uniref:Restriction modification system DNA specificity domain protein n=1 Tax=Haliscomenobacter hydrossis (strain ATCC 27775 / DSM 1100 / LMG 10767 / O) TaxID=760192 RepID=F4KRW3_HALH1|nr:restriction endonuclease subunit S [Haliscomenobacter hydrossis]AEE50067.1 restriction modification system DNA specificity domain protein [Haliscomenobacter hydrossis DSM 1100]
MINESKIKLKHSVSLRKERVEGLENSRPYIGLEHIESSSGRLLISPLENGDLPDEMAEAGESLCNLFEPGDVLFGKLRPYLAKAWVANFSGRCTTELIVLIPKLIDPYYLKYNFLEKELLDAITGSSFGSKMPRADWGFIGDQYIFFPPIDIQRRIASYLDRETTRIDGLISAKERLITLLAEKRQALITQAVTRGFDQEIKMKHAGVEWIGEVPDGWMEIRVKYLGDIFYGLSQPPGYHADGLPLVRATNVYRGEIRKEGLVFVNEDDLPESKKVILKTGDIIIVRSGAYTADSALVTEEWEGAVAGFDMVFKPNKRVNPNFLAYVLLSPYVLESQLIPMSVRAAQPHLNAEELGSTIVVLPPSVDEQFAIIQCLEKKISKLDALRVANTKSIELLKERRKALISAAVTGQIEITD